MMLTRSCVLLTIFIYPLQWNMFCFCPHPNFLTGLLFPVESFYILDMSLFADVWFVDIFSLLSHHLLTGYFLTASVHIQASFFNWVSIVLFFFLKFWFHVFVAGIWKYNWCLYVCQVPRDFYEPKLFLVQGFCVSVPVKFLRSYYILCSCSFLRHRPFTFTFDAYYSGQTF